MNNRPASDRYDHSNEPDQWDPEEREREQRHPPILAVGAGDGREPEEARLLSVHETHHRADTKNDGEDDQHQCP
jgi:hypothetical protein